MSNNVNLDRVYFKNFEQEDAVLVPSDFATHYDVKLYKDEVTGELLFYGGWFLIDNEYIETYGKKVMKGGKKPLEDILLKDELVGANIYLSDKNDPSNVKNIDTLCYKTEDDGGELVNDYLVRMKNEDGDLLIIFAVDNNFSEFQDKIKGLENYGINVNFNTY